MNLKIRKPKNLILSLVCGLMVVGCALCGSPALAQQAVPKGHHLFQSAPETLEYPAAPHFWNKAGLVISPARILAQVGTEVPMFAAVADAKGQLQPFEKVEWMLDKGGVGSFVSVAEADRSICLSLVSNKPQKIDNSYAWSETLPANVILTRGTPNINDDIVMPRGYTWVTVNSPREGVSYVTAYAPDVFSWEARQRSATIHWIDAEWSFPEPVCVPVGSHATLVTCVQRHTTHAPVSDWIVKYTITGGVEAGFAPDNCKSVEIATDAEGRSTVEVIPTTSANGATCISMELIRSECATPGEPERLSIASAATQITWAIPDAPGTTTSPAPTPATSAPATTTPMPAPALPPTTRPPLPTPVPTQPPATPPPSTAAPPAQPAAPPKIELSITGPDTAQLATDVHFIIEVTNRGTVKTPPLIITDRFDVGLEHELKNNPIQKRLDALDPGQSTKVAITFRVIRAGKLCHTVEVTGAGGIQEIKQACITVPAETQQTAEPTSMSVNITTPQKLVRVGDRPIFTVDVTNTGSTVPAKNVEMKVMFEQGLRVERASPDSQRTSDGGVKFILDALPPGTHAIRQVECSCIAPVSRACGSVDVSDLSKSHFFEEACVQIMPAQAAAPQSNLRLQITALNNPVKVGGNVTYRIAVSNAGSSSEQRVRLSVAFPDSMNFVSAGSQTNYSVDGNKIRFDPILEMRAPETVSFDVQLHSNRAGPAQVTAEVASPSLSQPLTESATTTIFAE